MLKKLNSLLLTILLSLAFNVVAEPAADNRYQGYIQDIEQRLDNTLSLYQQGEQNQAKSAVQMAYFEVFENLEGPIRINISAQKSYQLEATFGEIRKMITENQPESVIAGKINWLKNELNQLESVLNDGHQLAAEAQHSTYQNSDIAAYWQQSFQIIDDRLAEAITAYQNGDLDAAKKSVQQAQYEGYKNSEMEMAIRQNRSSSQSSALNQQFYDLIKATQQADNLTQLGYLSTQLLQDIEEQLPNLPITKQAQQLQAIASEQPQTNNSQNWQQIATDVNHGIQQALQLYQQGKRDDAIIAVQDTYFDVFESSGMESSVGSRDSQLKTTLEGFFTRLVGQMKAQQPLENLQQQANGLSQQLQSAVGLLQQTNDNAWSIFVYSLLIMLREGLEALLIVAAIVAYLVKNQHQDKLPVIRQSVIIALIASVITAFIFQLLFENSGANRELLEGITMIFAVIMLFMMSYWLLSKVEAQNWKRYLEGKLSTSLTTGSLIGLWLTSFLAVYREGAETVLFYYALVGDIQSADGYLYLLGGIIVGVVLLLIVYFIMRFTVVKLPLKPFFMLTGSFMYLMAFVFAGKSVLELIEGKLIQPTLLSGFPEIAWLGIYPYLETLIPQAVLILAAIFALFYMKSAAKKQALTDISH
ncbi:FTR1 family iron permease [Testudinibacter sp. TR-2022]|uniref:FTR1 family iron permease n=1 Tax=Testudinibacter sp. TR-2022 TaxID=2585029 RepID=UPI00111870E7|nr:FTR1 family protein [Testudinibacter sp. TR-2022]TNH04681.1 FTR1 family iron permease [Pasteurellaceae bacterium Phil31]TNH10135.1 FTR1 family iron permease [Testudinibacter sp. TR-2022]TNH12516.1 FTR1 family iron permease [Testudinibacter sp. TR-2022]TNH15539.1 FTR1 family iron permease [Testudinibacter sp. TR-2022]TNH17089.1 FTR1 family iron permease [Testudinibacter sp. TR-2022]